MTQKESSEHEAHAKQVPRKIGREVQGAPELPAHVAKQYGLHGHATSHEAESTHETHASDSPLLNDSDTDAAVVDIVAKESDDLLAMHMPDSPSSVPQKRGGFWHAVGHFFASWWRNKWARYSTLLLVFGGLAAVAVVPTGRYYALNTLGVRSQASVVVLDNATRLPLKNVQVSIGPATSKTGRDGKATFTNLKLGPTTLHIKRIAFAPEKRPVTIGWGSNPLGEYKLQATGVQYVLYVTDYVSGKALPDAEVTSDTASALSDKGGKVVLTVEDTEETTLKGTVAAKGYRSEPVMLDAERTSMAPTIAMVPDVRSVYVSKQSGRYDVFASDVDGKNKKVILAGTGKETSSNINLVTNKTGTYAAVASTREGLRDTDGYALVSLTLVNVETGASSVIDRGAQIQFIAWSGERLVYRVAIAGASAANAQRYRLVAYNVDSNAKVQLASANQFTTSLAAQGYVYYAASSTDPKANPGLFKIKLDGTNRKEVFDQEIWTGLRSSYNELSLQTPDGWYTYALDTEKTTAMTSSPNFNGYFFAEGFTAGLSAYIDQRDGKGTLLIYDATKDKTTVLANQDGLVYPLRWASEQAIIYRVTTAGEAADYVISPNGGEGRKITDVTPTYGFTQGY